MERVPVSSSNVVSVGYDQATRTLEVEFRSGVYQYDDVDPQEFEALLRAESVGRFLNANIKSSHAFSRVG